jgi:hypothetical protein
LKHEKRQKAKIAKQHTNQHTNTHYVHKHRLFAPPPRGIGGVGERVGIVIGVGAAARARERKKERKKEREKKIKVWLLVMNSLCLNVL